MRRENFREIVGWNEMIRIRVQLNKKEIGEAPRLLLKCYGIFSIFYLIFVKCYLINIMGDGVEYMY